MPNLGFNGKKIHWMAYKTDIKIIDRWYEGMCENADAHLFYAKIDDLTLTQQGMSWYQIEASTIQGGAPPA